MRRRCDRLGAKVPVSLTDGIEGLTRNVSPSGAYFVVNGNLQPGETIQFSMDFQSMPALAIDRVLRLNCTGRVVRVEGTDGKELGVAVEIIDSSLETIERVAAKPGSRTLKWA